MQRSMIASGLLCLLLIALDGRADESNGANAFNADEAWTEFEAQFRLFYAYIDRSDFAAEDVLNRARERATKAESAGAFRDVIRTALYAWTDNHLAVRPVSDGFNVVPSAADLILQRRDDTFVVQDVRRGSAAAASGVRPGWTVTTIDGRPALAAAQSVLGDLIPSPTQRQLNHAATIAANGRRGAERILEFRTPDSGRVTKTLGSPAEQAASVSQLPPVTLSRNDDVAILQVNNSLGNNQTIWAFDEALEEAIDANAFIVDLRNTPGGGNTEVARSILGHFVAETRSYQVHEIPSLEREFSVPRRFIEQVMPREPQVTDKPVVVLAGYWTGSMGEGLTIGFDAATDAHIIASDMADLLGGMITVSLHESQAYLSMGRESLFHVNGQPRELFMPEHALSFADTGTAGEDPAMTAAMKYLEQLTPSSTP